MTDPPSYDLRTSPFALAKSSTGPIAAGFEELFLRAHELEDLALPVPPAASGLLRILYVMAARITGLDDPDLAEDADEWLAARNALLRTGGFDPKAVRAYFDRADLKDRFYLFGGERQFLQDPLLAEQCKEAAGVNKLAYGRAAGNNHAWWSGHSDVAPVPLPAAQAAWYLIAQHYYGPSGRCSARTVNGSAVAKSTAGPLRKTVSFHPLGRNLYETLLLGIPRLTAGAADEDEAPWEEAAPPDPTRALSSVTWPGRLLAGRSRHAILLVPTPDGTAAENAYVTWATQQPPFTAVDPYVVMTTKADGTRAPRPADSTRALWRDLDALLLKSDPVAGFSRPLIFDDLNFLPEEMRSHVRVRAYGFDQDGQQVDRSWYSAVTPPLLDWLQERDTAKSKRISECRRSAEEHARSLEFAALLAWAEATSPPPAEGKQVKIDYKRPGPWATRAAAEYWPRAETVFWQLIENNAQVRTVFLAESEHALRAAVGGAERDMKVARAVGKALAILRAASKKNAR